MNLEIVISDHFARNLKRLAKRYNRFSDDYEAFINSLRENPVQGVEIAPNIRKIRLAIKAKGKGKSAGARVITYNALVTEKEGRIYLLLIYDKSDASNVNMNAINQIIRDLGIIKP